MLPSSSDAFRSSCSNAEEYPNNLLHVEQYGPSYASKALELKAENDRLWDAARAELRFRELHDGETECERLDIAHDRDLVHHLEKNRKDPRYRFVFLEADNSRVALNCSAGMFNVLGTHHQIPPSFLSNVLSFGEQALPRDYSLTTFQNDDNLYARDSEIVCLPELGRSGREIRHSFNIRTVEPSQSEPDWNWSLRNVAVYHSFDIETGRSFWLTAKADKAKGVIRTRLNKAINGELFSAESQATLQGSFRATLEILWIILDWSDENWSGCINSLDEALRNIVIKTRAAQIDRHGKLPRELIRALKKRASTVKPADSHQKTATFTEKIQAGVGTVLPGLSSKKNTVQDADSDTEMDSEGDKRALDNLSVLKSFTFEELQQLHLIGERCNEAQLVLGLTIQVVQSLVQYYETLITVDVVPNDIRNGCRHDIARFRQRMGNIERNLRVRQKQVESLARSAQESQTLFDGILQYRNMQISLLFAQSGYESSNKMESIARKTEQETTSMHVITVVTLLFLPPTFLAVSQLAIPDAKVLTVVKSFFQSGILQLKHPDQIEHDWMLLQGPWVLFIAISVGLMGMVLLIWMCMYGYLRYRARRRLQHAEMV